MVRFENGYPVTHELLTPDGDGCEAVTFRFPPEEGRSA